MYVNQVFSLTIQRSISLINAVFYSYLTGTLRFTHPTTNQSVSSRLG